MDKPHFINNYKKRWRYRSIALVVCMIVFLAIIAVGIYTYYDNKNNAVVVENLEDYKKALNDNSYIQISSDEVYDLNVDVVKTRSKLGIPLFKNVESKFVAIKLAPFTLGVELPKKDFEKFMSQKKGPYVLKGRLIGLEDKDLETLKQAIKNNYSLSGGFQLEPYLQYLRYESPMQSALLYFSFAGLLLIYVLALYIGVMRKNTVALKSLKNFSNEDFEKTCCKIDQELALPNVYKNGPVTITKNYLVIDNQQIVLALPIKELVWVYKQTIKRKIFFIIPAGKSHVLKLAFSDKNAYTISTLKNEKVIDEVIGYISENCKTCFVGYTKELRNLFYKDYDKFICRWKSHKENSTNMDM